MAYIHDEDGETPIEVHGGVVDLSQAPEPKEQNPVIPPVSITRLRIKSIKPRKFDSDNLAKLNIMFQLVDGLEEGKYQNACFWSNGDFFEQFIYYANLEVKTSDWYKNGEHLAAMTGLAKAAQITLTQGIDEMITELQGKEVMASIKQVSKTIMVDGEEKDTGEFENVAFNFKVAD